jgi:hypothetical protein
VSNETILPKRPSGTLSPPSRKVGASALAGSLSIVVVFIVNNYVLINGQTQISGEVASAITTILAFLVGYFVPEG